MTTEMPNKKSSELRLPVPAGWQHFAPPRPDVEVLMCPSGPLSGGDTSPIAAICSAVLPDLSEPVQQRVPGVQQRLCSVIPTLLEWPEIEDTEILDLDGHDVSYVRVTHQCNGRSLVSEVWSWVIGDEEWSITGTVTLEDYPTYCDVFESIADAFDPEVVWQHRRAG